MRRRWTKLGDHGTALMVAYPAEAVLDMAMVL